MSRHYKIYDHDYPYFVTSGIIFGLPIFSNPKAANIILENLIFLQDQWNISLCAYVIMENHFHAILQGENLEPKIGQFKSYSARCIIDLFKNDQNSRWLKRLRKLNSKSDQEYQLWKEGFHPKQIIGDKMMSQKISYIHNNPVKRRYVDEPEHWRYSSARNYAGMDGLIPINQY